MKPLLTAVSNTVGSTAPQIASSTSTVGKRLASIDAYRGLVMFLMLAEVLELSGLAEHFPGNRFFAWLRFHTTHVDWVGCSLHDMIQPSFSFLVGVSLPFSIASRRQKGSKLGSMLLHAFWRGLLLVVLGIVLRSLGKPMTNFTFDDTLTQIGLGYFLLFLIALTPRWTQVMSVALVLLGYWALFASWPLVSADFDYQTVGVPNDWPHLLSGFAAHWNKNVNPAWAFDVWFLNQFPRMTAFEFHGGGYSTLSFIPTLATMMLGVLAGGILASGVLGSGLQASSVLVSGVAASGSMGSNRSYGKRTALLVGCGATMLASGWALDHFGICPNVKRIWTPAFVLFSGGICFVWLAVLHMVCDWWKFRAWAFPFMIIGANSILAYVMSWTCEKPFKDMLLRHFGTRPFLIRGEAWEPVLLGVAVLTLMWLILFWLYRQRIFVRI